VSNKVNFVIVFLAFCFIYFSIFWHVCREICFVISKCIRASNVSSRHITRRSCDPLLNLEYRYLLHSTNVSLISSLFCCHLCFIRRVPSITVTRFPIILFMFTSENKIMWYIFVAYFIAGCITLPCCQTTSRRGIHM
jgi:hypothetical protein